MPTCPSSCISHLNNLPNIQGREPVAQRETILSFLLPSLLPSYLLLILFPSSLTYLSTSLHPISCKARILSSFFILSNSLTWSSEPLASPASSCPAMPSHTVHTAPSLCAGHTHVPNIPWLCRAFCPFLLCKLRQDAFVVVVPTLSFPD